MYYPNLKVVSIAMMLQSTDDAIIWRGPLKHRLIEQFVGDICWGDLDYLVIDLPPGTAMNRSAWRMYSSALMGRLSSPLRRMWPYWIHYKA